METDSRIVGEGNDDGRFPAEVGVKRNEKMAKVIMPQAPKSMSHEEVMDVRTQALELVERLTSASGSEEMEILDGAGNLGHQAQAKSAGQLDLLKARIHTFMDEGGTSKDIATGLRDLRLVLNEINPQVVTHPGFADRVFSALPFFKGRYDQASRALRRVAIRYEPASRQVTAIESRLQEGRALLIRDNVELRLLYEQVEAQQLPLLKNAYLGELLIENLTELHEKTTEPVRKDRIQSAIHDIIVKVQDLRTMEEVNLQYMISMDMSRQNNNLLSQSVYRTITLANNVVMVGLAIQAALIRQRRVRFAAMETRRFLGDLVEDNAGAIKRQTLEIGDISNSPVIAMEKISQAHDDLIEALQIAGRLRQEGIESARQNIARLGQMSAELQERIGGVIEGDEALPKSLEA